LSIPRESKPAKLVISLFMKDKALLEPISAQLVEKFGPVDIISSWLPFDYTSYYEPEMGSPLFRRMLVFKTLIDQCSLPDVKLFTNTIEHSCSSGGKRQVNIDPGYLVHERFVLATGKNFTHRIYIGKGIYADLTLIFTRGAFQTLPWTYPDYAHENMLTFLEQVRKKFALDFKDIEGIKSAEKTGNNIYD